MAALDTSGLRPLDTSGLESLDTSGLQPLDTSGLRPLEIDENDQPGRLRTASSQFARGLGSIASGLPKSVGLIGTPDPDIFRNFDRIDQGKFVIPKPIQSNVIGVELADPMESLYEDYIAATPEQRQAIRNTFEDRVRAAQEGPAYRTGQSIDKFIAGNFPVNPELQDEFWSSKVPQALGSATGFALSAVATRGALGGGTAASFVAPAALGSAVNRVDQFESALAEGAEIGDALRAAQLGGIIGTTEAIPIGNLLNRLDRISGGQVKRYVARAVQQGTEEAVQEAFSGILNAAVAQQLYDPEKGIWTAERGEEAAIGFTTGAILETLATLALPGRRRGSVNLESPESVQANAEARLQELEAADGLSELETEERNFLRENRTRPSVIAEAYGIQMEPLGERDMAREASPQLTEDDIASPIPDDLILEGKAVVEDALAADRASEALREAGFPEVDTDVVVDGERARVVDAIDGGAKIEYEDGQVVPESFESLSGRVRPAEVQDAEEVRSDTRQGDQRRDEREGREIEGGADLQRPEEAGASASDRPRQAAPAQKAETSAPRRTAEQAPEALDTSGLTPIQSDVSRESPNVDSTMAIQDSDLIIEQRVDDTRDARIRDGRDDRAPAAEETRLGDQAGIPPSEVVAPVQPESNSTEGAGTAVRTDLPAERQAADGEPPLTGEPEVPEGMTRLYHGSAEHGRYTGPAWFSTNRKYAENYRENAELQFVDMPTEWVNEKLDPDGLGQSVEAGFTLNIEIGSDETGARRPVVAEALQAQDRLRGNRIDDEWVQFAPESQTRAIPRNDMPQIKAEHRGALANFLKARGIEGAEEAVAASTLKPTQAEFSEKKVQKAKDFEGGDRAILVSSDGHVLDGHHQWIAAADQGQDIRIIRLDAPIRDLLAVVPEFPSAEGGDGMRAPATQSVTVSPDSEASVPESPSFGDVARETSNALADMFAEQFREGTTFKFIAQARKAAGNQVGRKIEAGTADTKLVDEAVELGVIIEARRIVAQGLPPQETYSQLVDLYKRMPKLGARTSTSIEQQAYSTPAPLAYLAAQAAGIDGNTTVYEPSAGNGALLMTADPAKVTANELNGERAANLRDTLPGATVTEEDAAESRPDSTFDVVIANPPFGAIKNEEGQTVRFRVDERYETAEIDHAISLKSLESMDANGSAVLIVGSVKKTAKTDAQRSDAYNAKAKREFYLTLYQAYNVVDHFTVSGELYERQGAGWPVDVIVIRGRKPSQRQVPAADVPRRYTSWEALGNVLDSQYEQATDGVRAPDRGRVAETGQPRAGDERGRARGREDRPDRQPGRTEAGERADVREGSVDRQPADARPAEPAPRRPARPAESERPARRPRRTEVSDNARQVAYTPVSSAQPMDTLVPVNMQTSVDDALSKLRGKVGNLDTFVSERLGYSPDNLGDYFGAEQVDAIALALDNMERGAGFIIGDQCVAGETKILDPETGKETAIRDLARAGNSITVLSMSRHGLVAARASKPFLKGVTDLYRVTLDNGRSITVTQGHRFLTESGWSSIRSGLAVGDRVVSSDSAECALSLHSVVSSLQPCVREGVDHLTHAAEGFQSRYSSDRRQCGERLLAALGSDLSRAPLPGGVHGHSRSQLRLDGLDASTKRNHHHLSCAHHSRNNSAPSSARDLSGFSNQEHALSAQASHETHQAPCTFAHESSPSRQAIDGVSSGQQAARVHKPLASVDHTGLCPVVSIEFDRRDAFYDMHVPGTLNYIAGGVINHNTGIGKGRVVAAMIRYALREGRTPIFVTEKPNLYGDMYRDMNDIGIPEMLGREPDMLMTNAAQRVPLDDSGKKVLRSKAAATHNAMLRQFAEEGNIAGYDVVFTTYSQMQTVRGAETPRMQFLDAIAEGGIVIMDESHNAGGTAGGERQAKGQELNRAEFARRITRKAHGVFYSSATYAKRPDVMDLYASTDMSLAVSDISNLSEAISKGGVPMQQVVASMLSRSGQYIRRERSFDGVVYNSPVIEVPRTTYASYSQALAGIQGFSERFIGPATKRMDRDLKAEGKQVSADGSTGGAGAASTNFTAIMHNLIDQMLLSIKADAAAERAIKAIQNGEKPVITVSNTMGSFIADFAEDMGVAPGDRIKIDFNELLERYLDRTRRITVRQPFMKKGEKGEQIYLTDEMLGPKGVARFEAVREQIRAIDFSVLPVSPIDHIRRRLVDAGYSVGEITGRQNTIDYRPDGDYYRRRPSKEVSIAGRRKAIADFNDGKTDAMILNQAGSTGLSLHASATFKDQKKRRMIIAQAEKNIDTHMQMLGRVHRTGQVVTPEYDQLVANVPAEKRPAAVLAKKMASLNANTTASRGGALTAEDVPDFINQYGDLVAYRLMADMPEIHTQLGEPLKSDQPADAMRKVTGRIPLLPLDQQELIYDLLESEYKALVEQKEAAGESILEAKTLPLDARTLTRTQTVAPLSGEDSPFADAVYLETVNVKRLSKPHPQAKVLDMIADSIGVERNTLSGDNIDNIVSQGRKAAQALAAENRQDIQAYRQEVLDEIENEKRRAVAEEKLNGQIQRIGSFLRTAPVGQSVRLMTDEGNFYGVVTSIKPTGKTKNPAALGSWKITFAIADASRQITMPLSQMATEETKPTNVDDLIIVEPAKNITNDMTVYEAFDQLQNELREERTMVTGNILAGFEHVNGRGAIVNFTDTEGNVRQGILMPREYDYAKARQNLPVLFRTTDQVIDFVSQGHRVESRDEAVELRQMGNSIRIDVAAAKRKGGRYYLDKGVRDAAGADFVKVGNVMRLDVPMQQAQPVAEALRKTGAAFRAIDGLEAARTIVGGQEAPEQFSLTDKAERKLDAVQANLQERLKQIGIDDRIAQKTVNMILDQRGQPILGARGRYARRTIEVAMTARDPQWTFNHEVIHALRDLDLITASEWVTLKKAVSADKPLVKLIQRRYGKRKLSSEMMYEEAVADMHANWVNGKFRPSTTIGRIFERIRDFLEALASAWRGNGFNSVGQIFRRIQAGEVAQRGRQGVPRDMRGASEGSFATVFHGSPHTFDEFTTDAMGSGEGNQSFGWGLYFAEVKEVARGYQARLSAGRGIHDSDVIARVLEGTGGDRVRAYKELQSRGAAANRREPGSGERFNRMAEKVRAGFDPRGQLYEVTIPDNVVERMLDWDAPLSGQPASIQDGVKSLLTGLGDRVNEMTGKEIYKDWLQQMRGQKWASNQLANVGIPGIRYRDGFSRNIDGGSGTRNLVLFDPADITQVKRNGQLVSGSEGQELFSLEPSNFNRRRARRAQIKFDKEETERRWQEARKGLAGQRTLYSVVRDSLNNVAQGFARHYRDLPNQAEFSEAREKLRAIEAAPQAAKEEALRTLRAIVDGMTPADVELFTRKVVLDDLTYEVGQDHQLPFGMSPADVRRELAKVNDALTPEMRDRVQLRNRLVRQVADELVRSGVLSEEQVRNPAYYRHQVLDYARAQVNRAKTAGKKLRSPMWARRLGSRLDINANLLEAEFEWLQKALTDVAVADTIEWFKDSSYNIRNDVVASARAHNQKIVDGILAQDLRQNAFEKNGRMTSPLNEEWNSFKQRIAVGLKQVRDAIESGDVLGIPATLQPAAASLGSDTSSSNVFPLLSWIIDNDQPGSMGAAMAFKAINQRKLWMKTVLGDRYADTLDLDGLVKRGFAPENYTTWQPDEGNLLFTAKTIPEHVMDRMLDKIAQDGAGNISAAEMRAALDSVKSIMAVGGPKYQLVIRDELADTFNSLRDEHADGLIESAFSTPLAYWKRWVLINPRRVIKYNLNNLSGDLDAVIAGSPRVVRKLPQAIRELWQVMIKGETPSDRYREAVDRGVFDSGLTIQEIPDIQYLDEFETLINPPSPIKNPLRYFTSRLVKVWRALQRYTWFRENWMRYAAYLDYVERLEAGESMRSIGYGAGKREMVDAIADDKDKAALLARELVGDYGAISHYGQGIRRKLIPFYSWMEINTKRYWRFGGNAWDQGVGAGFRQAGLIGASLGIRTTAYLTLRMAMLYGMVQLWNNLVMGDEEEELSVQERARLHITLGRDADNNIRTLRFQGALSDFLGWVGFEDALAMAAEVERGRATAGDVAQVMAKAPVNRVLNGMTPVISAPVEYLSGKKYWPDVFRPRPIRDRARNLAQLFSVEHEYDVIFNKPSRGYTASVEQTVVYKRNLGQNAYNRIKGLSYDWLRREKGLEGSGGYVTPRSQALYEWRLAKKLGDTAAERKAENRLTELGVSGTDLRQSVRRAHPLGAVAMRDRPAFLESLTPKERDMLDQAIDWYNETYLDQ